MTTLYEYGAHETGTLKPYKTFIDTISYKEPVKNIKNNGRVISDM